MEKLLSRVINFLGGMEDSPREILSRIGANFMVLSRAYGKPCTARHDPSPVRSSQDQSGITTSFFYGSFLGSKKLPISERCHPSLRARFPPGIFFAIPGDFFSPSMPHQFPGYLQHVKPRSCHFDNICNILEPLLRQLQHFGARD